MRIRWQYWNRVFHRDLGYFFFGMSLIYAISGIALNHIKDWNPNYIIQQRKVQLGQPLQAENLSREKAMALLVECGEKANSYKKHYFPQPGVLKIFIHSGSVELDMQTGTGIVEKLSRRPVLYYVNFLHYNPRRLWLWFSDAFCIALIIIAVTGLFIIKGQKGITGRGAWLTGIGILIPLALLLIYV